MPPSFRVRTAVLALSCVGGVVTAALLPLSASWTAEVGSEITVRFAIGFVSVLVFSYFGGFLARTISEGFPDKLGIVPFAAEWNPGDGRRIARILRRHQQLLTQHGKFSSATADEIDTLRKRVAYLEEFVLDLSRNQQGNAVQETDRVASELGSEDA
jgi:hypothetical protein